MWRASLWLTTLTERAWCLLAGHDPETYRSRSWCARCGRPLT